MCHLPMPMWRLVYGPGYAYALRAYGDAVLACRYLAPRNAKR